MADASSRIPWRPAFWVYALALVIATHWPALAIQSPAFSRLDLVIHAAAFGGWAVLLVMAGFFGARLGRRNLVLSCAVALVYSLVDELSQGVPALRRTVDPLDLAANVTGVLLAIGTLAAFAAVQNRGR